MKTNFTLFLHVFIVLGVYAILICLSRIVKEVKPELFNYTIMSIIVFIYCFAIKMGQLAAIYDMYHNKK